MALIEFKNLPDTSTPLSAENLNNNFNELNNRGIYSTEEQVIGTWIDGKPLYRKVIETPISATNTHIDLSSMNIDAMVAIKGFAKTNGGIQMTINFYNSGDYYVSAWYYAQRLYKTCSEAYEGTLYAILEYTKTTD